MGATILGLRAAHSLRTMPTYSLQPARHRFWMELLLGTTLEQPLMASAYLNDKEIAQKERLLQHMHHGRLSPAMSSRPKCLQFSESEPTGSSNSETRAGVGASKQANASSKQQPGKRRLKWASVLDPAFHMLGCSSAVSLRVLAAPVNSLRTKGN